ncbi:S-layer protein [Bacillus pseudomycoides]|uniref:TnsA endonuclease N-terminal domain-containing protein n=1 Tax=Bacillus pseudomycoides TaxID=64104 RepID=UPI000BEC449E|nr:TnsA endonuclease N-terminal domain-containing protein [Bacillus pseudomycoides]MBD5797379.1 S-layer protein [Bacillus pseudomycoides]MED1476511.1 TnsA endonuclease N-terminal domain-containing protein [Bacillus pseudomycoides]PDZ13428.1 S-layer protein [Bacillus pseudomycoides]PEO83582.1 S-layer protein [Bacillus pseudomycoides]
MPRNKHYGSNYWTSYSPKLKRDVHFYSDLEYDHWLLVETNPLIAVFCEQPLKVNFTFEGKNRYTIFDMWIKEHTGEEYLIEVKYSSEMSKNHRNYERTMRQIETQQRWCENNNIAYRVLTEKEIRNNYILLDNCRLLLSFTKHFHESLPSTEASVMEIVKQRRCTIFEIINSLSGLDYRHVQMAIFKLCFEGNIQCDLEKEPLGELTEVRYE